MKKRSAEKAWRTPGASGQCRSANCCLAGMELAMKSNRLKFASILDDRAWKLADDQHIQQDFRSPWPPFAQRDFRDQRRSKDFQLGPDHRADGERRDGRN